MTIFTDLNTIALSITALVLAGQMFAFYKTLRLAGNIKRSFEVADVSVQLSDLSVTRTDTLPLPRLQLAQKAHNRAASNLVAAVNLAVGTADSVTHQIRTFRETVSNYAEWTDEHATTIANVPVYLGLMGTFAGIMAGVYQIVVRGGLSERSIRDLLGGVIVAMFASFIGLALMTVSNAIVLPGARIVRDRKMAQYILSFESQADRIAAQIEEPVADLAHRQLLRGIHTLADSFAQFSHSIQAQREQLEIVERLNLPEIASANARMLMEVAPLLEKMRAIASMDLPGLAATNARLAEELPELITGIGGLAKLDLPELIKVNTRLLAQLPLILQGISEIEKTSVVVAQRFTSFQIGEMNINAVMKDLSTLPTILEVLQQMRSEGSPTTTGARLSDGALQQVADQPSASSQGARIASFTVCGVALVCLVVGILQFRGTYFGASLSIGGGLLAYEAGYVLLSVRKEKRS